MPPSRRLELVNESPMAGQMVVYLEDPEKAPGDSWPLVWQSRDCGPGRSVRLDWEEELGLTYGPLVHPGFVFSGGEIQPAGPGAFILGPSASGYSLRPAAPAGNDEAAASDGASEDYVPEDIAAGFVLSLRPGEKRRSLADLVRDQAAPPAAPAQAGRIQISVEPDTPALAIALCLAGRPALLYPAELGQNLGFSARPRYRAGFGPFEPGLVLDPAQVVLTTDFDFTGGPLRIVFRRDCQWETT